MLVKYRIWLKKVKSANNNQIGTLLIKQFAKSNQSESIVKIRYLFKFKQKKKITLHWNERNFYFFFTLWAMIKSQKCSLWISVDWYLNIDYLLIIFQILTVLFMKIVKNIL